MANFKVGDWVRARGLDEANTYTGTVVKVTDSYLEVIKGSNFPNWRCRALSRGEYATADGMWDNKTKLEKISPLEYAGSMVITSGGAGSDSVVYTDTSGCVPTLGTITNPTKPTMSLKTIYRNLTRTEPQRTFVKAGVCFDDGSFTPEGRELFLEYLLKQNGEAFKKDVVDAIVTEKEECE